MTTKRLNLLVNDIGVDFRGKKGPKPSRFKFLDTLKIIFRLKYGIE